MIETRESWFSGNLGEMPIFDQKILSKCWLSIDKVALESVNNETWNPENVGPLVGTQQSHRSNVEGCNLPETSRKGSATWGGSH